MKYLILILFTITVALNAKDSNDKPFRVVKLKPGKTDILLVCINENGKRQFRLKSGFALSEIPELTFQIFEPVRHDDKGGVWCRILEIEDITTFNPKTKIKTSTQAKLPIGYVAKGVSLDHVKVSSEYNIAINRNHEKGLVSYTIPVVMVKDKLITLEIFIAQDRQVLKDLLPSAEKKELDYIPGLDK